MFRNTSTVQLINEDVQDVQLIHYNVEKVESTYAGKRSQFHYQVLSWSFLEYFLYTQYHVHRKRKRFRGTAVRCDLYRTVPVYVIFKKISEMVYSYLPPWGGGYDKMA